MNLFIGYQFEYSFNLINLKNNKSMFNEDFLFKKLNRTFYEDKSNMYRFIGPLNIKDYFDSEK